MLPDSRLSIRLPKLLKICLLVITGSMLHFSGARAQGAGPDHHALSADPFSDTWKTLGSLTYQQKGEAYIPVFNEKIKAMSGKQIVMRGYIIPMEETKQQSYFMLSLYPFSSCFFCGGAGPETIVEVEASTPFEYTSQPVEVSGVLKLNESDHDRLFYILEKATPVK
jgi:hypothetical protein